MGLKLKNITKSFDSKLLFDNFSLNFYEKGLYVIKGESGSGKTTLLRIIAGLDRDYKGEVEGGGYDNVSVCFQEYRLFPQLTALDNILEVISEASSEEQRFNAKKLLRYLNFTDNDMNLKPAELSGGMKQRVAFVRAVLRKSNILILDEVTKELDAELSKKILDIIKAEAEERLVLLVTHKQDEIDYLGGNIINI